MKNIKVKAIRIFLLLSIFILVAIPLFRQGIIVNDELQSRYWSFRGADQFLSHYFQSNTFEKGRAISVFLPFFMLFGFFSSSPLIFSLIKILVIYLNIFLFSLLVDKVFSCRKFSFLVGILLAVFLPLSFEHTLPNAYSSIYALPLSLFFLSLIFFVNYLKKKNKKAIILSSICLFISLTSYEAFLPLTIIFFFSAYYFNEENHFKNKIYFVFKKSLLPLITTLFYLTLYFFSRFLFPSQYAGTIFSFSSINNIFKVILRLTIGAFPGYLSFTGRYLYIFNQLTNDSLHHGLDLLLNGNYLSALQLLFAQFLTWRVILILLFLLIFIKFIVITKGKINNLERFDPFVPLISLFFSFLPNLPMSLSQSYQSQIIGKSEFAIFPSTYFSYFFIVFAIAYVCYHIFSQKKIWLKLIVILTLLIWTIPIQAMNDVFSLKQKEIMQRLIKIEDFFNSPETQLLNNQPVNADDLYQTQMTLAIHDQYWSDFAALKNINLLTKEASAAISLKYIGNQVIVEKLNSL